MARKLVIPLLPKPHYHALKTIWTALPARQGELIVAGIELLSRSTGSIVSGSRTGWR